MMLTQLHNLKRFEHHVIRHSFAVHDAVQVAFANQSVLPRPKPAQDERRIKATEDEHDIVSTDGIRAEPNSPSTRDEWSSIQRYVLHNV